MPKIFQIFVLALISFTLSSQSSNEYRVTDSYVLENVLVVSKPGDKPIKQSILIQNGLIIDIGNSISIPPDAEIIKIDSFYVYAGFINPMSHIGIPTSEKKEERPKIKDPGNPPNDLAGIQPELSVVEMIAVKDKSIVSWRKAGFTTAHVVPKGKMFPGQGAIINLAGKTPDAMLLKSNVSMYSQLAGARRMYPGTIIGVLAKWKEMYHQAEYAQQHEQLYAAKPKGMERPNYDRSLKALYPVINLQQAVYFKAEKTLDISRVMTLQKELGFNIVLTEMKQAWPNLERIMALNAPVLLSMDIPSMEEKPKDDDAKPGDAEKAKDDDAKPVDTEKAKDDDAKPVDAEKEALKVRKQESAAMYQKQAGLFEASGVDFGFSFLNAKSTDVHKNIRIMIDQGLSEAGALAALTTTPAEILGISHLCGTIEKGKIANLVVSDKPYFDKEAQLKYVFVDGSPFKLKTKKKKKKSGKGDADGAIGKWSYEIETPGGTRTGYIIIKKTEGSFTSSISSQDAPDDFLEADDVEIDGNEVSFNFTRNFDGRSMTFEMDFSIAEDTLDGTISNPMFGAIPMTGSKMDDPKK